MTSRLSYRTWLSSFEDKYYQLFGDLKCQTNQEFFGSCNAINDRDVWPCIPDVAPTTSGLSVSGQILTPNY